MRVIERDVYVIDAGCGVSDRWVRLGGGRIWFRIVGFGWVRYTYLVDISFFVQAFAYSKRIIWYKICQFAFQPGLRSLGKHFTDHFSLG